MPLTIQQVRGKVCPIVACDVCGQRIAAGRDGNYEWDSAAEAPVVYFSHKDCTHRLRAVHGDIDSWGPLSALPAFLVYNLAMTWDDAEASAEFAESV